MYNRVRLPSILLACVCLLATYCSNPKKPGVTENPEIRIEIVVTGITVTTVVPVNDIETVTLTFYHGDVLHTSTLIDFTETDRALLRAEDVGGTGVFLIAEGRDTGGNIVSYGYLDIGTLHPEESAELAITLDWTILRSATSGFPIKYVNGTCVDAAGGLWAATDSIGVCHYDGTRWKMYGMSYGLPGVQVNTVLCDMAGRVWAGTNDGVYLLGQNGMWAVHDTLFTGVVRTIAENPKDSILYFGVAGYSPVSSVYDGLYRMEPDGSWSQPLAGHDVECIAFGGGDSVWCGTSDRGLFLVTDSLEASYGTVDGLPAVMVVGLCYAADGVLWIGTTGGLATYASGSLTAYGAGTLFERTGIQDIRQDAAGKLWAVSSNLVYTSTGGVWSAFPAVLNNRHYHHIHIDSWNRKWISTRGNGLLLHTGT